jgi:phosphohistidine phosphatase SixA
VKTNKEMVKEMTETLEVRLIRHGEKSGDIITQEAKKAAYELGQQLFSDGYTPRIITSPKTRAILTGGYILRGYNDAQRGVVADTTQAGFYDDTSLPALGQPEPLLKAATLPRLDELLSCGKINETQEVSTYYEMVRRPQGYDPEEAKEVRQTAVQYLSVALQYLRGQEIPTEQQAQITDAKKSLVILIGHEPLIGCVQQLLEPEDQIQPVAYLDGIRFTTNGNVVDVSFNNAGQQYQAMIVQ